MTRGPDLSLSVALASFRSVPIHRKAALYELFAILMDEAGHRDDTPLLTTAVKDTIEFIIAHYSEPGIDLRALTRSAHLSSSRLWALFKREVGVSPMRFLRETRLRQGAALLEQTSLRVGEIALRVGFADPLYFSRAFSQLFRCSPVTYRKNAIRRAPPGVGNMRARRTARSAAPRS